MILLIIAYVARECWCHLTRPNHFLNGDGHEVGSGEDGREGGERKREVAISMGMLTQL